MKRWKRISFNRRMRIMLTTIIVLTTTVVLVVSTVSSISTIVDKSRTLLTMQVQTGARSIGTLLDSYWNLAIAMMLSKDVQSYLAPDPYAVSHTNLDTLRSSMNSFLTLSPETVFLAVIRAWPGIYQFKGALSSQFEAHYAAELKRSAPTGRGDMRVAVGSRYSIPSLPLLTFYTPVYSTLNINKTVGALALGVRADQLRASLDVGDGSFPYEAMLVSGEGGVILSSLDERKINTVFPSLDRLGGRSGSFGVDGHLYVFSRLDGWNLYAVSGTTYSALFRSSLNTVVVLIVIIIAMVTVSLLVVHYMIQRMYSSLEKLGGGMESVAAGNLAVRLDASDQPVDIARLYDGFNSMTGHIESLMERIKGEERQIEQIRYNALQAQIHPHFLYNTLDCIRWMAQSGGNQDIVRLVKALAQYYRICLSRGKDVISLAEEIEFTRNYMIIQNIRYGGMLRFEVDVPPELAECRIPKITLQPLVENCVSHGYRDEDAPFEIDIRARRDGRFVVLTVRDNGAGMTQEEIDALNDSLREGDEDIGYGVRNVNRRLGLLFGRESCMVYEQGEKGGVRVTLRLPEGEA